MGQVRDLTPLREADGRLVALPAVEDALTAGLDAIRNIQAQRPQNKRFDTNRIMMYVWPPTELTTDELQRAGPAHPADHRGRRAWRRSSSWPASATPAGELTEVAVRIALDPGHGVQLSRRRAVDRADAAAGRLPPEGAARAPGAATSTRTS